MSTRIPFALILAAAVVPPGAPNGPVSTPSEILANPDRFDGQVVTIEGTMTNLRQRVSRRGDPYYKFDLSDGKQAISVFSLGRSPCRSGAVMVEGTFNKMKRGRRYTSYNVVNASRVICRQGSPGDEPGAGRAIRGDAGTNPCRQPSSKCASVIAVSDQTSGGRKEWFVTAPSPAQPMVRSLHQARRLLQVPWERYTPACQRRPFEAARG